MNKTTCSVCMGTYNGEKSVYEQAKSILHQLSPFDELIVSDDASKDRTIELLRSFNDDRIKIFPNNFRSGVTGNFENAINHASGDIIFLSDQDDLWMDNKLKKHLEMHQNYDLVISDAIVIDDQKNILFESFFKARNSGLGFIKNLKRNSYLGCCMSFNRKIISSALPFPPDIPMHDWWIGLTAELIGKICFLNDPLIYYVRHSKNVTATLVKGLPFSQQLKNRLIFIKDIIFASNKIMSAKKR